MNMHVLVDNDRTIPLEDLLGAFEVAILLTEKMGEPVTSQEVSTWAYRHAHTGFPRPVRRLNRGGLWDRSDIVDADGNLLWGGLKGRW